MKSTLTKFIRLIKARWMLVDEIVIENLIKRIPLGFIGMEI
jgi:hypothetical protein